MANNTEGSPLAGRMATPNSTPISCNPDARLLFLLMIGTLAWIILVFYFKRFFNFNIITTYVLLVVLAFSSFLAIRFARAGTSDIPAPALLPAILFVIGGAAFDMGATVYHSWDLCARTIRSCAVCWIRATECRLSTVTPSWPKDSTYSSSVRSGRPF